MASDRTAVGKSVRACDNCVRRRARWYCAADDAFLCDSCDSSVHSANPLARRHERVRLNISSSKEKETSSDDERKSGGAPTWQKGFTRKARTPRRQKKSGSVGGFPAGVVPEEEEEVEENEEQLLYRVPVFDVERNRITGEGLKSDGFARVTDDFGGILPSELDLDEFAADVESLLGKGLDDMELGLGIFGQGDECFSRIKDEDEEIGAAAAAAEAEAEAEEEGNLPQFDDLGSEGFELNFDYCEFEEDDDENKRQNRENKALLKLDYDRVMSAWDYRKSPWTTGERPEFSSGDWWPDCFSGTSGAMHAYADHTTARGVADGGREARVSRYREKRRTRLFSKKIRYEVRKLNAEKRPRMKGRFVKRPSFASSPFPPLLNK